MNNKRQFLLTLVAGVMIAGLLIIGWAALATTSARADASAAALRIDMTLFGAVALEWATTGELTDSLTPPVNNDPAVLNDLGDMDLGFLLERQSPGSDIVYGYVDLTNTLVFSVEHALDTTTPTTTTVTLRDGGPSVSGTFDGASFTLLSEQFDHQTAAGQTVQRQFRLIGTGTPQLVTGEYRETIWGYALEPVTIVGTFTLNIINSPTAVPTSVGARGIATSTTSIVLVLVALALVVGATAVVVRRKRA